MWIKLGRSRRNYGAYDAGLGICLEKCFRDQLKVLAGWIWVEMKEEGSQTLPAVDREEDWVVMHSKKRKASRGFMLAGSVREGLRGPGIKSGQSTLAGLSRGIEPQGPPLSRDHRQEEHRVV